jgi:hypothetical protein
MGLLGFLSYMIILLQRKLEELEIWVTVAVEGVGTCTSRVQIK